MMFNRLLLSVLLLTGVAPVAFAYTCPDWVKQLPAKQDYKGDIVYEIIGLPQSKDPVTSTFKFRPKNCTVVGNYTYFDTLNQRQVTGQFSAIQPRADRKLDRKLNMVWHDQYGFGLLDIQFDPPLKSFSGKWGAPYTNEHAGKWTGNVQ